MSQVDEFFDGLPSEDKQVDANIFDEATPTPEVPEKVEEEGHKNRRHRRLEAQIQTEREARIAAEARAEALSESAKFSKDIDTLPVDDRWTRIYGDTPETRLAWKLQQDILADYKEKVKEEALQEIERRQSESTRQQKEFESFIDEELEAIEDKFNVDVTSDAPAARKARREFLEMVQTLSPKDETGTITGYANFEATWDMYQLKRNQTQGNTDRRKDLGSRSMLRSTGADIEKENDDTNLRYLRSIGMKL